MAPACERCGPLTLPAITIGCVARDGAEYQLCGACWAERERIEPTARKGGKPSVPIRAGSRQVKL